MYKSKVTNVTYHGVSLIFFFSGCGVIRELVSKASRALFRNSIVVVSNYDRRAVAAALRMANRIVMDRPPSGMALWNNTKVEVIDASKDDAAAWMAHGHLKPPEIAVANSGHSDHEAMAFDLRSRGLAYAEIAAIMRCDVQTAKTYLTRARQKNAKSPEIASLLALIAQRELP